MGDNNWMADQDQAVGDGEISAISNGAPSATMDAGDWRAQLHADSRRRIINKIMETLKRHLPICGQEGLQELERIAEGFEKRTYTTATSQPEYLRKISMKMLCMEMKYQNPRVNSLQAGAVNTSKSPRVQVAKRKKPARDIYSPHLHSLGSADNVTCTEVQLVEVVGSSADNEDASELSTCAAPRKRTRLAKFKQVAMDVPSQSVIPSIDVTGWLQRAKLSVSKISMSSSGFQTPSDHDVNRSIEEIEQKMFDFVIGPMERALSSDFALFTKTISDFKHVAESDMASSVKQFFDSFITTLPYRISTITKAQNIACECEDFLVKRKTLADSVLKQIAQVEASQQAILDLQAKEQQLLAELDQVRQCKASLESSQAQLYMNSTADVESLTEMNKQYPQIEKRKAASDSDLTLQRSDFNQLKTFVLTILGDEKVKKLNAQHASQSQRGG